MQVANGQCDLSPVETRPVLGEDALSREMEEQLSAVDVLHNKTQPCISLEGELERLLKDVGGRGGGKERGGQ